MNPAQRECGQRKLSDLDQEIKKLWELMGASVTEESREFWSVQADRLQEQRKKLGARLRHELTSKSLDLLAT